MNTLFLINGMIYGVAILLILQLSLYHREFEFNKWVIAFIVALISYTSLSLPIELPSFLHYLRMFFFVNSPAFLLYICLFFFKEQKSLEAKHYLAMFFCTFAMGNDYLMASSNTLLVTAAWTAELIRLAITAWAIWLVISNWKDDLVETRRLFRWLIALTVGIHILVATIIELFITSAYPDAIPIYKLVNSCIILFFLLIIVNWMIGPGLTQFIATVAIATPPTSQEKEQIANQSDLLSLKKLGEIVDKEKVYQENGLTIGKLAHQLDLKEHYLRRLINKHLGYRNFNDYLNRYRIAEVTDRLSKSSQNHIPILTIVLEAGYSSLTPFNRAFKMTHNQTPSEFRRISQSG